tara:strand:- start:570 stop:1385 length:816 start_codon:yes stop_codon:yes gene_type:complete
MKFFQLTRNERLGLVGVILIFIVIISFKYFDAQVIVDYKPSSIENTKEEILSITETNRKVKEDVVFSKDKRLININAFEKFNPNVVGFEYWKKIGFENKLAVRLEKFIQSGLGIKNIYDLEKVYGMKKEWIELIKDSVVFKLSFIDINSASAESFQTINGIGEIISNRIIKFRNSLGGFYSIRQLENVYGIDSDIIRRNYDVFKLNTVHSKMNVNKSGLKKLKKHPFINAQQAEEIIKIRSVYGKIDSIKLKDIFTAKEWSDVKYYLKWEN